MSRNRTKSLLLTYSSNMMRVHSEFVDIHQMSCEGHFEVKVLSD